MNPLLLSLIVMVVISGGAAHRYDGRSFAIGEGVVVAVGDEFRDDNAQRRYHIEIENERVSVASQRDGALRCRLNLREIEAQRLNIAAEVGCPRHLAA